MTIKPGSLVVVAVAGGSSKRRTIAGWENARVGIRRAFVGGVHNVGDGPKLPKFVASVRPGTVAVVVVMMPFYMTNKRMRRFDVLVVTPGAVGWIMDENIVELSS
jgi:hypothetical protein